MALLCPHCDENGQHCMTDESRIQQIQDWLTGCLENQLRIEFRRLNLLFREVVKILRSLGIMYLWIDTMCIVQDSKIDWESEASKMAAVYSNARLTVSASEAISPDDFQSILCIPVMPRHSVVWSTSSTMARSRKAVGVSKSVVYRAELSILDLVNCVGSVPGPRVMSILQITRD